MKFHTAPGNSDPYIYIYIYIYIYTHMQYIYIYIYIHIYSIYIYTHTYIHIALSLSLHPFLQKYGSNCAQKEKDNNSDCNILYTKNRQFSPSSPTIYTKTNKCILYNDDSNKYILISIMKYPKQAKRIVQALILECVS